LFVQAIQFVIKKLSQGQEEGLATIMIKSSLEFSCLDTLQHIKIKSQLIT